MDLICVDLSIILVDLLLICYSVALSHEAKQISEQCKRCDIFAVGQISLKKIKKDHDDTCCIIAVLQNSKILD